MIVGIQPEQQGAWKSHLTLYYGSQLTIEKFFRRAIRMGEAKVWNVSSTPVNGTLALVIEGNGQQRNLKTTNYQGLDSYWESYSWSNLRLPPDLPDGDYQIYLRFRDDRDANWQVVRTEYGKPNSVVINIANGTFTIKNNRTNYDWVTAIETPTVSDAEAPVRVYNLQGHKLLQLPAAAFSVSQLPMHGFFIVKQGKKTMKIVR